MTTPSSTRFRLRGSGHNRPKRPRRFDRFGLWLYIHSKYVDGLWVGIWDDEADTKLVWRRVEGALTLIKTYDRLRYDRLLCDLERVCVRLIPYGLACYNKAIDACELDTRFVIADASSPELIASAIVHEATHARLRRCGIGYEQQLRARVEAVCFRREIAFAARLPYGEQARERAERSLQFYSTDAFWTDAASTERYLDGAMAAMRHLGIPEWLVRIFASLYALRHRIPGSTRRRQNGQADLRQRWPGRERP